MCDFENGFKLCTCTAIDTPKDTTENDAPTQYIWELRVLDKTELCVGKCIFPDEDIGQGLDEEWVLLNLNLEDCFDFEYTPINGDNLRFFEQGNHYRFLSFIYKNGAWEPGFYDELTELSALKKKGYIKADTKA